MKWQRMRACSTEFAQWFLTLADLGKKLDSNMAEL